MLILLSIYRKQPPFRWTHLDNIAWSAAAARWAVTSNVAAAAAAAAAVAGDMAEPTDLQCCFPVPPGLSLLSMLEMENDVYGGAADLTAGDSRPPPPPPLPTPLPPLPAVIAAAAAAVAIIIVLQAAVIGPLPVPPVVGPRSLLQHNSSSSSLPVTSIRGDSDMPRSVQQSRIFSPEPTELRDGNRNVLRWSRKRTKNPLLRYP